MRKLIYIVFALIAFQPVFSQEDRKHIRQGNSFYEDGEFKNAEESYLEAVEKKPGSYAGAYNLGNATYRQGKYEDASNQFELTAKKDVDKELIARSYHNLGNSLLQGKQYEKSIAAYKNALRNNPGDKDTKYNLAYAQQMLAQQQEQQQDKDNKGQENKDQQEQEEKDKQDQQEQEEKDKQDQQEQEQKDTQSKDGDEKKEEKQEDQQKPQPDKISKKDAQRLLDALKNDEQKLQEKLKKRKLKATKIKIEKDW